MVSYACVMTLLKTLPHHVVKSYATKTYKSNSCKYKKGTVAVRMEASVRSGEWMNPHQRGWRVKRAEGSDNK